MARLGDIATVITKGTTPTSIGFAFQNKGINFVKIESIDENGNFIDEKFDHISDECHKKLKRSQLQENDVLFSIAGAIGRTAIVTKNILPANINQALAIIRIPQGIINYSFLLYILQSSAVLEQAEKKQQGVAQLNVSLKDIGDFIIPDIPLAKQQKIVDNLDKVSNLISLRKQQLSRLDELVKSRFIEMFGDVITNSKKWEVKNWNSVLSIKNGRNQKQVENPTGKYPICGSGGIMGYADDYITTENSVIVGRKGNINKPILMREKYWNVDTAFGLEPKTDVLLVDYLYMYCVFFNFETLNKAVTIPSLTKADLLNIEMPVPPLDLQNQFADFVEQVDKSKLAVQKSLEKLETLKKALMQKYFG